MAEERPKDSASADENMLLLMRIIATSLSKKDVQIGHAGDGGEKRMLGWLLGLLASLVVVSVVGGVTLFGKVSAIEANQQSQQRQLDQLATQVSTLRRGP